MRKPLSYILAILGFCSITYADTTTSGVGLIKPTTGIIDTTESWASKINRNFDIVGSSLNTADSRLDSLDTSTTAITARLDDLDASTETLTLHKSNTNYAEFLAVRLSTQSALLDASNTNYVNLSATGQSKIGTFGVQSIFYASGTIEVSSITLFGTITSTSPNAFAGDGSSLLNISSLSTTGSGIGEFGSDSVIPQIKFNEDGRIVSVSSFNASGADGFIRTYDIVIGTPGAVGVDFAVTNNDGSRSLQNAIDNLPNGGVIFVRAGVYALTGTTIPKNITLIGEPTFSSGTIFVPAFSTSPILSIYGQVKDISFGFNKYVAGNNSPRFIQPRSNSRIINCNIVEAQSLGNDSVIMFIYKSTDILIKDLHITNMEDNPAVVVSGDRAPILVEGSTGVHFIGLRIDSVTHTTGGDTLFAFFDSSDILFADGVYNIVQESFKFTRHCSNITFRNNKVRLGGASAGSIGLFLSIDTSGAGTQLSCSSSIHIVNNDIEVVFGLAGSSILYLGGGGDNASGMVVEGNNVHVPRGTSSLGTFVTVDANVVAAIIKGNTVSGIPTFISDSGIETQYTTLGNFYGRVQQ